MKIKIPGLGFLRYYMHYPAWDWSTNSIGFDGTLKDKLADSRSIKPAAAPMQSKRRIQRLPPHHVPQTGNRPGQNTDAPR